MSAFQAKWSKVSMVFILVVVYLKDFFSVFFILLVVFSCNTSHVKEA